ncbi:MAG: RHS repeat-associated core domain-containing protein [Armatimonadetes bacterium]|nr:RHS repeat-associated core domain-containing protein [Armatimonadota bacterium]
MSCYYVLDALGHVRVLLSGGGAVLEVWRYDSWGVPLSPPENLIPQPFLWNGAYGYEWDCFGGTGLYHVGARAYDPRTARWLQRDPIDAASGDPNLYRYCGNDPLTHADPSGLKAIALVEDIDIFGWITNLLGGGSVGFGGGLLYALTFENRPSRTGQAKLGCPSSTWPFWDRSFHLDGPHENAPNPHFNAEYGPLKWLNHTDVPDWLYRLGNNRVLRNIGRGAVGLGLALDALDIATAGPCDRGRAIGGAVGGAVGAAVGGAIGSMLAPGAGTWIGGTIGGLAGSALGQLIGTWFDPECDCSNRR